MEFAGGRPERAKFMFRTEQNSISEFCSVRNKMRIQPSVPYGTKSNSRTLFRTEQDSAAQSEPRSGVAARKRKRRKRKNRAQGFHGPKTACGQTDYGRLVLDARPVLGLSRGFAAISIETDLLQSLHRGLHLLHGLQHRRAGGFAGRIAGVLH